MVPWKGAEGEVAAGGEAARCDEGVGNVDAIEAARGACGSEEGVGRSVARGARPRPTPLVCGRRPRAALEPGISQARVEIIRILLY